MCHIATNIGDSTLVIEFDGKLVSWQDTGIL